MAHPVIITFWRSLKMFNSKMFLRLDRFLCDIFKTNCLHNFLSEAASKNRWHTKRDRFRSSYGRYPRMQMRISLGTDSILWKSSECSCFYTARWPGCWYFETLSLYASFMIRGIWRVFSFSADASCWHSHDAAGCCHCAAGRFTTNPGPRPGHVWAGETSFQTGFASCDVPQPQVSVSSLCCVYCVYFGPGVAQSESGVWWLCAFGPQAGLLPGITVYYTIYYLLLLVLCCFSSLSKKYTFVHFGSTESYKNKFLELFLQR